MAYSHLLTRVLRKETAMPANIYVLNHDGTPLMPSHSYGRVKKMLHTGKARIAGTKPFTIRLTYQIDTPAIQPVILGIDPGRTNIGNCAVETSGKVLYASLVETRNKEIPKLMKERQGHRQMSRRGERKRLQRRAIRADKTGMARATEYWRMLTGQKKPIRCKVIRNQEAKFQNRKRPIGWLTPTAEQLARTHLNVVRKIQKILPVSAVVIEINRFDFARMENPDIENWEYQRGRLAGYADVREAVSRQQKGKCLLCGRKQIEHYHHIVPKSQGGSESIDNYAGLCMACHEKVHQDEIARGKLQSKKKGIQKKYHALSVLNQIMPALLRELPKLVPAFITTGYETHRIRESVGLQEKQKGDDTHYMDAWCIAMSIVGTYETEPDFSGLYRMKQFRRHDRASVKAQKERTYYHNGKAVAKNRHKRTGQADAKVPFPSLAEYLQEHPEHKGRLTVRKSTRSYNNTKRNLPGTVYTECGNPFVLRATQSNGTRLYGMGEGMDYHKTVRCKLSQHNAGLVYI